MSNYSSDLKPETQALIKFSGSPTNPSYEEKGVWWRFKYAFKRFWSDSIDPEAQKVYGLADAFAHAEVAKREGEAAKFTAEAEEAAARADHERVEATRLLNDEIARIFAGDQLEPAAALQFANLCQRHPDLAEKMEHFEALYSRLKHTRGFQASIPDEKPKGSPDLPGLEPHN